MPEASARLNERRATRSAHQDFHTKPVCKKGREHKQGPRSATLTIRNALQQPPSRMTEHAQEGPPRAARKVYESPPPRARTCTWPHAHTHTHDVKRACFLHLLGLIAGPMESTPCAEWGPIPRRLTRHQSLLAPWLPKRSCPRPERACHEANACAKKSLALDVQS